MMGKGPRYHFDQRRAFHERVTRRAFTLIELLVVIAVIALLIGILLPALSSARRSGAQNRETAGGKQLGAAYIVYTLDNKGLVLPGYLKSSWASRGVDPAHEFVVYDHAEPSEYFRLTGSSARKYPWRLAPYLDYSMQAMILDHSLFADYRALPDSRDDQYGFQYAFASNPSFGLNTTYVGGDARRGAFYAPSLLRWGSFYVTRVDQPVFTDQLIIFATARGTRVNGTDVVPGNHRVEGPWNANSGSNQVPTFTHWSAPPGRFDASRSDTTYGHLDFRHFGKSITVTFDGHAESLDVRAISDMRRWSNQATTPDWHPQ